MSPLWWRSCSIYAVSLLRSLFFLLHLAQLLVPVTDAAEPLKIRPKQCNNAFGEEGTCMFVWECIKTEGKHLGTCADGFLFGSCCGHNDSTNAIASQLAEASSPPITFATTAAKVKPKPTVGSTTTTTTTTTPSPQTTSAPATKPATLKPIIVQTVLTIRPANSTKPPSSHNKPMVTTARPWQVFTGHPGHYPNKPIFAPTYRPTYVSVGPVKNRPPIYFIRPTPRPTITVIQQQQQHFTPPPTPTNITHTSLVVVGGDTGGKTPMLPGLGDGAIVLTSNLSPPRPTIPINQATNNNNVTVANVNTATTNNNIGNNITTSNSTEFVTTSDGNEESGSSSSMKYECGVTQMRPKSKIVGGKNSAFGAWPWQVSVRRTSFFGFTSTHRCGGVILNSRWVATAGHCVDDLLLTQIRIRVGEYDFSTAMEPLPHIERGAKKKVVHPKYNFFTYENDLALVQLDQPLEFAPHVSPICLPPDEVQLIGKNATVTGWGRLTEGGVLPTVLQEVRVPIMSNERCKNMFLSAGRHEYIPDIFMCAGYEEGGRDSCQGDSGGPLQVQGDDGKWFLGGIVSWGISCGEPGLPGVCTRVSKYKNWMQTYINS